MYHHGRRQKSHVKRNLFIVFIVLAGLAAAGYWANGQLRTPTVLTQAPAVHRHVDVVTPPTKQVGNQLFGMAIPASWKATKPSFIPPAQYAWQGTGKEDSARWIQIYVDTIPADLPVNRLLTLSADGSGLLIDSNVSDNCVNFTDAAQTDQSTGKALAKWSGVTFYCDTGNYARNVIGTGSAGAVNSVTVTGPKHGSHRYFFVYTDHSAEPDYNTFTDMLKSFKAL